MKIREIKLEKIHDYLWEIPKYGGMQVPGRIYASEEMLEGHLKNDEALQQVINVAHLPGIQKYSLAMPDIHWGYGFPIGGIAATDINDGVISPGGVGYDINCGVRIARTSLDEKTVKKRIPKLIEELFRTVPTGVGASGAIKKLSPKDLSQIMIKGSEWAIEHGLGSSEDIQFTEEQGCLKGADPASVSQRAVERGLDQAGTLGSGNHFLELDIVDEIYEYVTAETFGLFPGQLLVMIHTGSRGFGYQICDDYLKILVKAEKRFKYDLPDKQLACAPLNSEECINYFSAMKCAANFAWNNRQVIMSLANKAIKKVFSISDQELEFRLVYDVCHNIAKTEEHEIDGVIKKVCVHRKGATRAFAAGNQQLPQVYKNIGQPVLIPGDMGRYSFIGIGTQKAMEETFGSSCHGAGRLMSRHKALKQGKGRDLIREMNIRGVEIRAKGMRTIAEEMPEAYKDVSDVIDVMHNSGIIRKIAKLRPIGVIKG